jgi:HSP90 family molecular chaperone
MSDGKMSSLDEYVSRCRPEQKEIYYLSAPTRSLAMHSPYLESFNKAGVEVIFLYSDIDDFVMTNLAKFEKKNLTSVEKSKIDLSIFSSNNDKNQKSKNNQTLLTEDEASKFCSWFQKILQDKVESCKVTDRLSSYPAIVTDTESAAMRKMMRYVNGNDGSGVDKLPLPKQNVEINPNNPIIAGLNVIRSTKPSLAKTCADQIFDNCLLAAGLIDDSQSMLRRINDILLALVTQNVSNVQDSVIPSNPIEAELINTSTRTIK